MSYLSQLSGSGGVLILAFLFFVTIKLVQLTVRRRSSHVPHLRGPPSTSLFTGCLQEKMSANYYRYRLEEWVNQYGSILKMPVGLGKNTVVLCDPKALAHFFAKDGYTYLRPPLLKAVVGSFLGHSIITSDKDDHKRHRRILAPAFTNNNLRGILDTFYDTAYKLKANWDGMFECSSEEVINVQEWMNRLTLDSIGIAGFGHDFKAIEGQKSAVAEAFDSFDTQEATESFHLILLLGSIAPQLARIMIKISGSPFQKLKSGLSEIATHLIQQSQTGNEEAEGRSILELLLKGQSDTSAKMSYDEVLSQGLVINAGYDTTAIILTSALLELSRNQATQEKLRDELRQFSSNDPTWDQLMSGLPYLDAVVHETLRHHAPLPEISREAGEDDVIPLSRPLKLSSGEMVDAISVQKGTIVVAPNAFINLSEEFWGPDAKKFIPERWLKESPCRDHELQGHRQVYTFGDGPRNCVGKVFALAEFKAALSVLVRNFSFELPGGPETRIDIHRSSFMPRPKVAGEAGAVLPLRVRPVDKY